METITRKPEAPEEAPRPKAAPPEPGLHVVAEMPISRGRAASWSTSMLLGGAISLPVSVAVYQTLSGDQVSPMDLFAAMMFGGAGMNKVLYVGRLILGYVGLILAPSAMVQGLSALLLRFYGGRPHFDRARGRVWSEGRFTRNQYMLALQLSCVVPILGLLVLMKFWHQPWLAIAFSMVLGMSLQPMSVLLRVQRFKPAVQVESGWEGLRIYGRPGDAPLPSEPRQVIADAAIGVVLSVFGVMLFTELIYLVLLMIVYAAASQGQSKEMYFLLCYATSSPQPRVRLDTASFVSFLLMVSCGGGAGYAMVGLRRRQAAVVREQKEDVAKAFELHKNLIPSEPPEVAGLQIASTCQSMHDFGGDFFTYMRPSEWELGLALGDVSGHGLQAAINAALALGVLDCESSRSIDPAQLLTEMNSTIMKRIHSQSWVALSLAMINLRSGFMRYANAGQPYAMVKRGSKVEIIRRGGLPMGRVASARYQETLVRLQPGSFVVFATDGVLGAASPLGGFYGRERLAKVLEEFDGSQTPQALIDLVLSDLTSFAGKMQQDDDVTMIVIKMLENGSVQRAPLA